MQSLKRAVEPFLGIVFGAGLTLVVLPCAALYLLFRESAGAAHPPTVGLPILAIFGILVLFGTLALVATLFSRLGMSDRRQALGLPEGSIRAVIALSLIVLFAIIAIMLHESSGEVLRIPALTMVQKDGTLRENASRVTAVVPERCPDADVGAVECFSVYLTPATNTEASAFAKQLLVLIGTLMTSVTSFYFATRALEPPKDPVPADTRTDPVVAAGALVDVEDGHIDGCDVAIDTPTSDHELPAARGGVS